MTRRNLFAAVMATPAIAATPKPERKRVAWSDCRVSFIRGTRVWIDGREVTNECFRSEVFSDGTGTVGLYVRDGSGRFCINDATRRLAEKTVDGRVRMVFPDEQKARAMGLLL